MYNIIQKENLTENSNKEFHIIKQKSESRRFKAISNILKPRNFIILSLCFIIAGAITGCAESRINSVTTDSPYVANDAPKLVLSGEHFGGGYTIEDTDKRTFFTGGTITNYGNKAAYSVTIRVRILDSTGTVCDDHFIYLNDIWPSKSASFDEKYEVVKNYKGFEAILTYQTEDKIQTVVLKSTTSNINNLEKNTY